MHLLRKWLLLLGRRLVGALKQQVGDDYTEDHLKHQMSLVLDDVRRMQLAARLQQIPEIPHCLCHINQRHVRFLDLLLRAG